MEKLRAQPAETSLAASLGAHLARSCSWKKSRDSNTGTRDEIWASPAATVNHSTTFLSPSACYCSTLPQDLSCIVLGLFSFVLLLVFLYFWAYKKIESSYCLESRCGKTVYFGWWFVSGTGGRSFSAPPYPLFLVSCVDGKVKWWTIAPGAAAVESHYACVWYRLSSPVSQRFGAVGYCNISWLIQLLLGHFLASLPIPNCNRGSRFSCSSFYPQSLVTGMPDTWKATNKSFMGWNNDSISRKDLSEDLISTAGKTWSGSYVRKSDKGILFEGKNNDLGFISKALGNNLFFKKEMSYHAKKIRYGQEMTCLFAFIYGSITTEKYSRNWGKKPVIWSHI